MSFLIDPPWLYANGRAPRSPPSARRPHGGRSPRPRSRSSGASVSLYFNRPWTRRSGRLPRRGRPRLDAQLRRVEARPPGRRPATHAVSGALFATYPLWLWLGWRDGRRVTAARFPHVALGRPLRVVLPPRGRPGAPAQRLDPPHHPPAPRASRRRLGVVHAFRRRRGRAARASSSRCPAPRRGRLDRDRREHVRARAADGPGAGRTAAWELACDRRRRAAAPPPARVDVPRAAAAHEAREPAAGAPFDGSLEVGEHGLRGRRLAAGWLGHNWGAEHAARWIWLHGVAFDDAPGAWLDLSLGRVRVGPLLTPWIANGACTSAARASGSAARGRPRVAATPAGCRVETAGAAVEARSPAGQTVAWRYADPNGGEHHSPTARSREVTRPPRGGRELRTAHGGATSSASRATTTACRCSRSRTATTLISPRALERAVHVRLGFARWNEKRISPPRPAHFTPRAGGRSRPPPAGRARRSPSRPAPARAPPEARGERAVVRVDRLDGDPLEQLERRRRPTQHSHAGEMSSARASAASRSGPP